MSMLQPHELYILDKKEEFGGYKELLKFSEVELIRLANNFAENYSILVAHYVDRRDYCQELDQLNKGCQQGSLDNPQHGSLDNPQYGSLDNPQQGSLDIPQQNKLDLAKSLGLQEKELADDKTLLALPPLEKLECINESALVIFDNLGKVEAKILDLELGSAGMEWKKIHGEEESGMWWENDWASPT
ncbi:MAG: hypothetical protein Q9195_005682 [Heterodermia aff. obscurata]